MKSTDGDLNPRPPECKQFSEQMWTDFRIWLHNTHEAGGAKELFTYAKRYCIVLQKPSEASKLLLLSKHMRRNVMSSLSNLSKFLGVYDQWKQTIKRFGLKWENTNNLETFLSILNTDLNEVEDWIKQLIPKMPRNYASVLVFDALTGLRPTEATHSCSLITKLSEQNKLDKYLDTKLMMLQHFRFPKLFLRKSKNAYISFVTPQLIELITKTKPTMKYSAVDTMIGRLGFKIRTRQLRKLYATTLRKYLPQEMVDLLQGRISQSIFMRFYYRPLLEDTRNKVIKAIEPLQNQLLELVNRN